MATKRVEVEAKQTTTPHDTHSRSHPLRSFRRTTVRQTDSKTIAKQAARVEATKDHENSIPVCWIVSGLTFRVRHEITGHYDCNALAVWHGPIERY